MAKAAMNEIGGILFSPINMAGMPPPAQHPKSPNLDPRPTTTTPNCPTWTPPNRPSRSPPPAPPIPPPPPFALLNPPPQMPPPPPPPPKGPPANS